MTNTIFINMPVNSVTEIPITVNEGIKTLLTNKRAKQFHDKINSFINSLATTDVKYHILNDDRSVTVYVYCKETVEEMLILLKKLKNNEPLLTLVNRHTHIRDIHPKIHSIQKTLQEQLFDKVKSVDVGKWLKQNGSFIQDTMDFGVIEYTINFSMGRVQKSEWHIPLHELDDMELEYLKRGEVTSFIQTVSLEKRKAIDEPIELTTLRQFYIDHNKEIDESNSKLRLNSSDKWERTLLIVKVIQTVMYYFLLYFPIQSKLVQTKPTNELLAPKILPKELRSVLDYYDNEEDIEADEEVRYEEVTLKRIDYIELTENEELLKWINTNETVQGNILSLFDNYCNTKLAYFNKLSTADRFKMLLNNINDSK